MDRREPDRRFSIPLERSLQPRKPGRWMPVIWLLFAVTLTVAIIGLVQNYVPIEPEDQMNANVQPVLTPDAPLTSPVGAASATPAFATSIAGETLASPAPTVAPSIAPPVPAIPATAEVKAAPAVTPSVAPTPSAVNSKTLAAGSPGRLVQKAEFVQREGDRIKGYITLKAGTQVTVDEALPGDRYRVSWRESQAEVAAASVEPLAP